jgi:hypothetical protein
LIPRESAGNPVESVVDLLVLIPVVVADDEMDGIDRRCLEELLAEARTIERASSVKPSKQTRQVEEPNRVTDLTRKSRVRNNSLGTGTLAVRIPGEWAGPRRKRRLPRLFKGSVSLSFPGRKSRRRKSRLPAPAASPRLVGNGRSPEPCMRPARRQRADGDAGGDH